MPSITIDGRGNTVRDAIRDMWKRMEGLQEKGFRPLTDVEVVDTSTKKIIETYQITDPEFQLHLKSDVKETSKPIHREEHHPPTPHEYTFIARIKLEN